MSKAEKKPLTKGQLAKRIVLISLASIAGLLVLAVLAAYIGGAILYGNMNVETPDTSMRDDRDLTSILREDINAPCDGYPEESVDRVRSSIVLDMINTLPAGYDYEAMVAILTGNKDADISMYTEGLDETEQQISCIRWAVHYGYGFLLLDIGDEDETVEPPFTLPKDDTEPGDATTEPGDETTGPEGEATGPEGETTGPGDETTEPGDVTTGPEDVTTGGDTTTEATTTPPETWPDTDDEKTNPDATVLPPITQPKPDTGEIGDVTDDDIYNVLILGIDGVGGSAMLGNNDVIMIASINRVTKRVVLTSIQRDQFLKDPERGGYAKINSVYLRYAPTIGERAGRVMRFVEYNFDIKIHDYVILNFQIFKQVINAIGGVDVPMYYAEYCYMRGTSDSLTGLKPLYEAVAGGLQDKVPLTVHLNADQALIYARMRKGIENDVTGSISRGGDANRTERQRNVVIGVIDSLRDESFLDLMNLAKEIMGYVTCSLDYNSFLIKAAGYTDFMKYEVVAWNITGVNYTWYPCTMKDGVIYLSGEPGYGTGEAGQAIFELWPQYSNKSWTRDGYPYLKYMWRELTYKRATVSELWPKSASQVKNFKP